MNSVDHIIRIIAESREHLRSEFGVIGIGIFGSLARGEQGAGSDIDILYV
jgi:predicted nucleotidyltransferase